MKLIHHLNLFAIGLPILLFLAGIINDDFLFYGLLSTILTGLIQVMLGIKMFLEEPKSNSLKIYLLLAVLFFLLWIISSQTYNYSGTLIYLLVATPPLLAVFLTLIIIKKIRK